MTPTDVIREEAQEMTLGLYESEANPARFNKAAARVAAYMCAFGFALMSLCSVLCFDPEESMPMMVKWTGFSLVCYVAYKRLQQ